MWDRPFRYTDGVRALVFRANGNAPQHVSWMRIVTKSTLVACECSDWVTPGRQAVERTAAGGADGHKITLGAIKSRMGDLLYKITSQKFEDPAEVRADPEQSSPGPLSVRCGAMLGARAVGKAVLWTSTHRKAAGDRTVLTTAFPFCAPRSSRY